MQNQIKLKNFGFGIFYGNETSQLKAYSHKINISFENNEEDEDIIIDCGETTFVLNKKHLVSIGHLYRTNYTKDVAVMAHKSVPRCVKNFLVRNFKGSRKRIIKENSWGNFKGPHTSYEEIMTKFNNIKKMTSSFIFFLENATPSESFNINKEELQNAY